MDVRGFGKFGLQNFDELDYTKSINVQSVIF